MGTWRLKQKNALEKKERGAVREVCYYITYSYTMLYIYIYKLDSICLGAGMMC